MRRHSMGLVLLLSVASTGLQAKMVDAPEAGLALTVPDGFRPSATRRKGVLLQLEDAGGSQVLVARSSQQTTPELAKGRLIKNLELRYDRVMSIDERVQEVGRARGLRTSLLLRKSGVTEYGEALFMNGREGDLMVFASAPASGKAALGSMVDSVRPRNGGVAPASTKTSGGGTPKSAGPRPLQRGELRIPDTIFAFTPPPNWKVSRKQVEGFVHLQVSSPGREVEITLACNLEAETPAQDPAALFDQSARKILGGMFGDEDDVNLFMDEDTPYPEAKPYRHFRRYSWNQGGMVSDLPMAFVYTRGFFAINFINLPRSVSSDDYKIILQSLKSVRPVATQPPERRRESVKAPPPRNPSSQPPAGKTERLRIAGTAFSFIPPGGWSISKGKNHVALQLESDGDNMIFVSFLVETMDQEGSPAEVLAFAAKVYEEGYRERYANISKKESRGGRGAGFQGLYQRYEAGEGDETHELVTDFRLVGETLLCGIAVIMAPASQAEKEDLQQLLGSLAMVPPAGSSGQTAPRPAPPPAPAAPIPADEVRYVEKRDTQLQVCFKVPGHWEQHENPEENMTVWSAPGASEEQPELIMLSAWPRDQADYRDLPTALTPLRKLIIKDKDEILSEGKATMGGMVAHWILLKADSDEFKGLGSLLFFERPQHIGCLLTATPTGRSDRMEQHRNQLLRSLQPIK